MIYVWPGGVWGIALGAITVVIAVVAVGEWLIGKLK